MRFSYTSISNQDNLLRLWNYFYRVDYIINLTSSLCFFFLNIIDYYYIILNSLKLIQIILIHVFSFIRAYVFQFEMEMMRLLFLRQSMLLFLMGHHLFPLTFMHFLLWTIAPACPILLSGGAVIPAINPTTGFFCLLLFLIQSAALY